MRSPIWKALGEAELAASRPEAALDWLEKATASGSEHLEQPVAYVRSHYLMGLAYRRLGERDEARRSLERFATFGENSDLYREWLKN